MEAYGTLFTLQCTRYEFKVFVSSVVNDSRGDSVAPLGLHVCGWHPCRGFAPTAKFHRPRWGLLVRNFVGANHYSPGNNAGGGI